MEFQIKFKTKRILLKFKSLQSNDDYEIDLKRVANQIRVICTISSCFTVIKLQPDFGCWISMPQYKYLIGRKDHKFKKTLFLNLRRWLKQAF